MNIERVILDLQQEYKNEKGSLLSEYEALTLERRWKEADLLRKDIDIVLHQLAVIGEIRERVEKEETP